MKNNKNNNHKFKTNLSKKNKLKQFTIRKQIKI